MNVGSSPYYTVAAIYCRGLDGELLSALECYNDKKGCYVGLVSCDFPKSDCEGKDFQDWLKTFIVLETSLLPTLKTHYPQDFEARQITERIRALFATTLRNVASNDQWSLGADIFYQRVFDFVTRNDRIQMCLPAFPCKSPNLRKVGGGTPDRAERIALQTLHAFTQEVRKIYPPGVTIWVISDGHVFSDCIGVDDDIVSMYDTELHKAYQGMFKASNDREAIQFRGLTDLLFSNPTVRSTFCDSWTPSFHVDHPIQSIRSPDIETSRQVMMAGFQSSRQHFRKLIEEQHAPTLNLYRGQARFMQEDLCTPEYLAKSPKQRKKLAFVVAAEMIARNQAYSNLVELLFPNYIRLSIHAHTNRGPKFGICLFPRDRVRAIDSIRDRHELVPAYEFQVPTPWHNSIIMVAGDQTVYLGKASIVQTAIEQGEFEGKWVEDGSKGGYFFLTQAFNVSTASSVANASSSMGSVHYGDEKNIATAQNEVMGVVSIAATYGPHRAHFVVKIQGKLHHILRSSRQLVKRVITQRSS
ncbi:Pyoverdine/dityrosine biosynthesis protein-domain-containing protein [Pyrenochaeta sp. MPI-SDFR-AT-0127]|nr:Pyoverdine/dityrosine biosynthesis protein-domain-containing protein [Pyrenochaeta sp. MPI-SDFR-AT-0127]